MKSRDISPSLRMGGLTFRQIEAFVTASRCESMSEAARRLEISQPAMSTMIAKTEETLGVALFARDGRGVTLTPAGERFAHSAAELLNLYRSTVQSLALDIVRERVAIAMPPSVAQALAPGALADFTEQRPDVDIMIRDVDRSAAVSMLLEGSVDFAVIADPPNLRSFDLELYHVEGFELVIGAEPGAAFDGSVGWREIESVPLILAGNLVTRGYVETAWREDGFAIRPRFEVEHVSTALALVKAGLGGVILPSLHASELMPGLKRLAVASDHLQRKLYLVRPGNRPLSPAALALCEAFRHASKRVPA